MQHHLPICLLRNIIKRWRYSNQDLKLLLYLFHHFFYKKPPLMSSKENVQRGAKENRHLFHNRSLLLTCCGALWPLGTAKASLSKGMSTDGHSDLINVLVNPPYTLPPQLRKVIAVKITWINQEGLLLASPIMVQKLIRLQYTITCQRINATTC